MHAWIIGRLLSVAGFGFDAIHIVGQGSKGLEVAHVREVACLSSVGQSRFEGFIKCVQDLL